MAEEEHLPEPGRVNKVRNEWLVFEDGALAHNLQSEEFKNKYMFNRSTRQTARTDVPLAKYVQNEEEARLQRERLQMLERQKAIAERDAELAEKFQKLEVEKMKCARNTLERDDLAIAAQLQQEELLKERQERLEREMKDQEYARMLFEKEYKKYEYYLKKRELAKARKRLEAEQQQEAEKLLSSSSPEADVSQQMRGFSVSSQEEQQPSRVVRPDGRVEDLGDFSDFCLPPSDDMAEHEKKQFQELQDEELARILQDQEKKRGAQVDRSALKALEERDAQLAKIMQEQEKLKVWKRQPQLSTHHSAEDARTTEDESRERLPLASSESLPPPVPQKAISLLRYEDENSFNECVNEHPSDESFHNPTPLYRLQGQSPYCHRPLPETPQERTADRITVVPVRSNNVSPSGSPPPPGYRPPPAYPSPRNKLHKTSPDQERNTRSLGAQNVIAAIDPTFRDYNDCQRQGQNKPAPAGHQFDDVSVPSRQSHSPTGTLHHHTGTEDGYCDLDELGPVQGQRRSTLQREGQSHGGPKRNSCKQQ